MAAPSHSSSEPCASNYARVVYLLIGAWLGIAFLKFGNPIVFDGMFPPPRDWVQIIFLQWPATWGFIGVAILVLLAVPLMRCPPKNTPKWVLIVPAVWLFWQWIASFDSIQPELSRLTSMHFTFVTAFFYIGLLTTSGVRASLPVWIGIGVGLSFVISAGFQQQFGGLEETREFYEKLDRGEHSAEVQQEFDTAEFRRMWDTPAFRRKVQSERIYASLFTQTHSQGY